MLSCLYHNCAIFDILGTLAPLDKKSSKSLDFTRVVAKKQECKSLRNLAPLPYFWHSCPIFWHPCSLKMTMRLGRLLYQVAYFQSFNNTYRVCLSSKNIMISKHLQSRAQRLYLLCRKLTDVL